MRMTIFLAAAVVAVAATPLSAADAPAVGEQLIAHYPADWQRFPVPAPDKVAVIKMIPPGANAKDASEAISVQRHEGSKTTPKAYVDEAIASSRKNCEGLQVGPLDESPINGYKAATIRLACTKSAHTGKSGLLGITAIAGKEALHVQQLIWFGAPVGANQPVPVPTDTLKFWDVMMASTYLCDSRDAKHPCVQEKKPEPKKADGKK